MSGTLTIKCIDRDERSVKEALRLVLRVFLEYDAPLFSPEGKETFRAYVYSGVIERSLSEGLAHMAAAFDGDMIAGVMASDIYGHIMIAFVDGDYQHCGTGRALFEGIKMLVDADAFTVNAAPPGYPFYKALGFVPDGAERTVDGLVFTPMTLALR